MKKIIALILVILMCGATILTVHSIHTDKIEYNSYSQYIYFDGKLDAEQFKDNKFVTFIMKDNDSICYINQYEVGDDGTYYGKFKFNGNPSDCTISLKTGDLDVSSSLGIVYADKLFEVKEVSLRNNAGIEILEKEAEIFVKAVFKNKFADENTKVDLILAFYDEQGNMTGVSFEKTITLSQDVDVVFEDLAKVKVPEDAVSAKLFVWEMENLKPYCENITQTVKKDTTFMPDGDKELNVVLAGDSIVHQGKLIRWIEHLYATRFPDRKVNFINKGIGGDTALGVYNRLDWDVFENTVTPVPDVMLVHACTNDIVYNDYYQGSTVSEETKQRRITNCINNHKTLIDECMERGVKYTVLTPLMHDESDLAPKGTIGSLKGVNNAHLQVAQGLREYASTKNLNVIDIHKHTTQLDKNIRLYNPELSEVLCNDSVHCGENGAILSAYIFMKEQGASEFVANTVIDREKQKVVISDNSEISGLSCADTKIEFMYYPKSLPVAVTKEYKEIENSFGVNITEAFNKEIIKILNLSEGNYEITANGISLGIFDNNELSKGVNLAVNENYTGQKLAQEIYQLNFTKAQKEIDFRDMAAAYKQLKTRCAEYGVDVDNLDALEQWINTYLDTTNDTAYWKELMRNYPEKKKNEVSAWNEIKSITAQIREKQRYGEIKIVITKK